MGNEQLLLPQPAPIRVLAEEVIDQIAAGEVVERPASVARELLDNAVDAAARRIDVELLQGGIERLAVRDDGHGIPAAEVPLALQRHATSKIRRAEDLLAVRTLGFRGEALPSIASVSRLAVTSRTHDALAGVRLELAGGQRVRLGEVGAPPGTCVEVEELFFNVPARRKFLGSPRTEGGHVLEVCRRLALAHPAIHLTVREDGREVLRAPSAASLQERLPAVFGLAAASRLFPLDRAGSRVRVHGFLSAPDLHRATWDGVYLFVNGRSIRDRSLLGVIQAGYRGLLPGHRHPLAALFLELDPQEVDVNVHPQKAEVRFREEKAVRGSLIKAVQEALAAAPWLGLAEPPAADGTRTEPGGTAATVVVSPRRYALPEPGEAELEQGKLLLREALASFQPAARPPRPAASDANTMAPDEPPEAAGQEAAGRAGMAAAQPSCAPPSPGEALPTDAPGPAPAAGPGPSPGGSTATAGGFYARLRYLGQAGNTYLVCEGAEGLVVIDQHAAHERVTFERLTAGLTLDRPVASQTFLLPVRVELNPQARRTLEAQSRLLELLGLSVEPFGGESFLIKSIPSALVGVDPAPLLADLLDHLAGQEPFPELEGAEIPLPLRERLEAVCATMACHGSVRAGQPLAPVEVRALLAALEEVDYRGNCPHGRPVVVEIPFSELERRLKRR